MKVLQKGRKQKGSTKEYTCTGKGNGGGGCGAKLLVSEHDLKNQFFSVMGESAGSRTYFVCPECEVETNVQSSSW